MNNVAEIAGMAAQISLEKLEQTNTRAGMAALKGALQTQEMIQAEILQMLQQIRPELGTNINITA